MNGKLECRLCSFHPTEIVCDLGTSPPANSFIEDYSGKEVFSYPLNIEFCKNCFNLQLGKCLPAELLYSNYNYLTPHSTSLTNHYTSLKEDINEKIGNINNLSILEIGSNNGLLLKSLSQEAKQVLGIDPAKNVAQIANKNGVETINSFFNIDVIPEIFNLRKELDIIIARHMFAHNERPHDILEAAKKIFKKNDGHLIIENAYALDTLLHGEFDQIYHEHMYFYTVTSMKYFLEAFSFYLYDISFAEVHGGSVVFFASTKKQFESKLLKEQLDLEKKLFSDRKIFHEFNSKIALLKTSVLNEIEKYKARSLPVIAYGAPAKAFTMFSYFKLDNHLIDYCIDTTPTKQGKTFPSSNIPIISEDKIDNSKNKLILVNAWNYKEEIIKKSSSIFRKGDKLLFPLPEISEFIVS